MKLQVMEVERQGLAAARRLLAGLCDATTELLFSFFDPGPRGQLSIGAVVLIQDAPQRFTEVEEDYPLVGELTEVRRHVLRLYSRR